jgi:hypothetical protein
MVDRQMLPRQTKSTESWSDMVAEKKKKRLGIERERKGSLSLIELRQTPRYAKCDQQKRAELELDIGDAEEQR